jgi:hypothetical protein
MLHVGAVASGQYLDLAAAIRMLAQILQHGRLGALEAALAARCLLGEQRHGAVETDREHFLDAFDVGVHAVVQDEWSVAAETGADRLARFRMQTYLARERQELQREFEIDRSCVDAFRDAGALRLLVLGTLAELQVRTEAAGA